MNEVQPRIAQRAGQDVLLWLDQLRMGTPQAHQGLAIVPVYRKDEGPSVPYHVLSAALMSAIAEVEETESVPALRVRNGGDIPLFILDGEELAGGWQNRIANTSALVPGACTLTLPVTCVEQGAWGNHRGAFGESEVAFASLRRQAQAQSAAAYAHSASPRTDQGAIWAGVEMLHQRTHTASSTGAMRDAYAHRDSELSAALRALPFPDRDPVGVVALIGGSSYCADIFDAATTLRTYWPRLIRSYMLEALGRPAAQPRLSSAGRLLAYPCGAERAVYAAPGLGLDVRFASHAVEGAALVWEGVVVHAALFRRH